MNQPKFKFGDKVKCYERGIFTVERIQLIKGFYSYSFSDEPNRFSPEPSLELYQEPQKKKLYAYTTSIEGNTRNIEFKTVGGIYNNLDRVPEYDIEYPDAK